MARSLVLAIENDDIVAFRADVVALKYANGFHGADEAVAERLGPHAANRVEQAASAIHEYVLVDTKGRVEARQALFVGDIVEQIRLKIDGAAAVVADLTGSNPNVYLEVGYAWARGRPTILITRRIGDLQFDVRGQKCLAYSSIKQLEETLDQVLSDLQTQRVI